MTARGALEMQYCTLQWGSAPVMMSSASTSSMRTTCPVRAYFALTANLVMRPLMRCGRNQLTTTKVWFWENAVRLVTRPGAVGKAHSHVYIYIYICMYRQFWVITFWDNYVNECAWIHTRLSRLYVQRIAECSCSRRRRGRHLKRNRKLVWITLTD